MTARTGPMEAMCFPRFQNAAAGAATFELRVRLLAELAKDGTPVKKVALSAKLTDLIGLVAAHFGATEEETRFLNAVAVLRNKLFHLQLSRVSGRVESLLTQIEDEGIEVTLEKNAVWGGNLETGEVAPVSGTSTEREGIYGWMLESTLSGGFDAVVAVMREGIRIITRLRDELYKHLPVAEPGSQK